MSFCRAMLIPLALCLQHGRDPRCVQAVGRLARRSLDAEQVEGFCDVPTFIMGMSMGGALAVQTIRAVVSRLLYDACCLASLERS